MKEDTITINVRFFANVKQTMGKEGVTLNLDASKSYSIRDILREITKSENKELSTMLIEMEGKYRGVVRIVVNGEEIHFLDGLETKVQHGDRITIFPLLAGG
jgi:molybdopterin synthase sulfur carrier subunit